MSKANKNLYSNKDPFYVAVDCIIFGFGDGKLKLLAFNRSINPFKGKPSLLGSFVGLGESISEAASRTLEDITGLQKVYTRELQTYSSVDRDPGYRCISVAHYALIPISPKVLEITKAKGAQWFDIYSCPPLILDHDSMVNDALQRLQELARYKPLGFELLPKKFTIPQLQSLYESIYSRPLDPRNFRKKVLSLNVLIHLEEKDKSTSKKGAYLYTFDRKKYKKLQESGYNFEV